MKVDIAFNTDETRKISFQNNFPHVTKCCKCGKRARLGFVAHETEAEQGDRYVCHLWDSKPKQLWLHDACCVAVYFCEKCLEPTALYNQA